MAVRMNFENVLFNRVLTPFILLGRILTTRVALISPKWMNLPSHPKHPDGEWSVAGRFLLVTSPALLRAEPNIT
jgi:hypothetical protein